MGALPPATIPVRVSIPLELFELLVDVDREVVRGVIVLGLRPFRLGLSIRRGDPS
jgi:hypothetical protein